MNKLFAFIIVISFLFVGCNGVNSTKNQLELKVRTSKKIQIGDTISIEVISKKTDNSITAQQFYLGEKSLEKSSKGFIINNIKLGEHQLKAIVTTQDGVTDTLTQKLTIYNNKTPKLYGYKIVKEYPHSTTSYTQGLEFYKDTLYESTGLYGHSKLVKMNVFTDKVYQERIMASRFFGEGLTVLNDKIYQLTWRENTVFVYDTKNLEEIKKFTFPRKQEGWGICNDGKNLYMSDGSDKIWTINPDNFKELGHIQLCTNNSIYERANELEWVDGKIYANTYMKDGIMIINPENGAIEGIIDMRGLKEKVAQIADLDVLNGIAYNAKRQTFFVTGKNWSKMFEVTFYEK